MGEYIEREAAIKAVSENDFEGYATWAVKAIHAADVRPVVRGKWKRRGFFPAVCRICDDVILYPMPTYKPEMFIGWECQECKRRHT